MLTTHCPRYNLHMSTQYNDYRGISMKDKIIIGALAATVFFGYAFAGQDAMDEQQRFEAEYCESVAVWNEQKAQGVAQHDRYGHSDYRGAAGEWCK